MIEVFGSRPTAESLAERIRAACLIIEADRYLTGTDKLVLKILRGASEDDTEADS